MMIIAISCSMIIIDMHAQERYFSRAVRVCVCVYVLPPAYDVCVRQIELTSLVFTERQRFSTDGFRYI